MYVFVCVCVCVCVYVCLCVCVYVRMGECLYSNMYVYLYIMNYSKRIFYVAFKMDLNILSIMISIPLILFPSCKLCKPKPILLGLVPCWRVSEEQAVDDGPLSCFMWHMSLRYVRVYMYVCFFSVCLYFCVYVCVRLLMYGCMWTCVPIYVCVLCICVCLYVCVCVYDCGRLSLCVYVCV